MRRALQITGFLLAAYALWLVAANTATRSSRIRSEPTQTVPQPARSAPTRGKATLTTNQDEAIQQALADLSNQSGAPDLILRDLHSALMGASPERSAQAVLEFLRSGMDAETGQGFVVGGGGLLECAPSLRTALLDWLPGLDPEVALTAAREILKSTPSPDEYALALRNLAWNDLDGDLHEELSSAFHDMLNRREWQKDPSDGYLEAFDIAVRLNDRETFSRLSTLASIPSEMPELLRACCMSMDRMILRSPEHLTEAWQNHDGWMDQVPMQRASLMSRLDPTREDHLAVLLDYLQSPRADAAELSYFTRLFPNGNYLYGNRLATADENSPSIEQRIAMDRKIDAVIVRAIESASPSCREQLERIHNRLAPWVGDD